MERPNGSKTGLSKITACIEPRSAPSPAFAERAQMEAGELSIPGGEILDEWGASQGGKKDLGLGCEAGNRARSGRK